jgi:hypothetical protein
VLLFFHEIVVTRSERIDPSRRGDADRGGAMKMQRIEEPKKQRCFNADLIPVVAATGFTLNRKPRSKPLSLAQWNLEPRISRSPV